MRLGNDEEYVDISASPETYEGGAAGGDIFASIDVRVGSFSAGFGTIVEKGDWSVFMSALIALENTRRGEAGLRSADERELYLRIYASDSAGHMAVAGEFQQWDLTCQSRLVFDKVAFEPTWLPQLVSELTAAVSDKIDENSTTRLSGTASPNTPRNVPIETSLGRFFGRNCIYLDRITFEDSTLVLEGSINGNLCTIKHPNAFIPYSLRFLGVLALKLVELDSYHFNNESCFDEIRRSNWIHSLGGKVTTHHRHFYVQTYDDVFEVVCEKYEFEIKVDS